jgi:hypothetical protein
VDSRERAEAEIELFRRALSEHFVVRRQSGPRPYVQDLTAEFIDEHRKIMEHGRIAVLEADVWVVRDVDPPLEMHFPEDFRLSAQPSKVVLEPGVIASLVERHRFPVRILNEGAFPDLPDFLIISIKVPAFKPEASNP